ncbi:hypothetical protein HOU00_gp141 [Caulobacter phage CcrPW]|uniref:Uncharacterized protein n=1 Tax=Caulobacter phage CcrPW TaxID=2283271 RepID=A0A385EAT9_9CAUD|nr:hypothetical protein HOU00_gp141 [Caulobacter phage CcrPW]AXQ68984.1 hypothetical protein CcrPW_gp445 [Caulobacter phage CcrPW]
MNAVVAAGATGAWAARNAQLDRAHPNYEESREARADIWYAMILAVLGIIVVAWMNW